MEGRPTGAGGDVRGGPPPAANPPGEGAARGGEGFARGRAGSGWTTTKQAAKALNVSRRSVQSYVNRGLLKARSEGEGANKRFLVSIDSLSDLIERRKREAKPTPEARGAWSARAGQGDTGEQIGEALRAAIERLEARAAEVGDLRARLELTEQAESTLREELAREREERRRAREEADRLRGDLEAERGRGAWKIGAVVASAVTVLAALLAVLNEVLSG